ncbi:hypothetical protein CBR_g45959 [Chara braunii]|uniref:Uncharacterized protein n=1 Tax=Chara braunii TaxID=69332 RepID=A0A388LZY1_CHABU|nr:hypothetical protein CBR_g45959 [Chara braunii]|eukprot:GBG87803.1 hypothetical protein CBR_g45959 [Chara braunii]
MADVFRRLPLLLLVVLLLLLVVLFRVCILGNVPPRRCKRRSSMTDAKTEARQAIPRSGGEQVGGRRCGGSLSTVGRASQRVGYEALPPHLQPLPGSSEKEEEVERRPQTVSLGSGSTQEWAATELCGTGGIVYDQSFIELLRPGLSEDEGDGRVNLSFGLSTGRSTTPSRTVLVRPHPGDEGGQLTVVDRSARTRALASETTGANRNSSTPQPRAASLSKGALGRLEWMQLPSPLSAASEVARGHGVSVDGGTNFLDVGDGRDGREVWKDLRRDQRLRREECITWGKRCAMLAQRWRVQAVRGLTGEKGFVASLMTASGAGGHERAGLVSLMWERLSVKCFVVLLNSLRRPSFIFIRLYRI